MAEPIDSEEKVIARMKPGLTRWIENGIQPGSFLMAVILNDLRTAVVFGDRHSVAHLGAITRWVHETAPAESVGNVTCGQWEGTENAEPCCGGCRQIADVT